MHDPFAESQVTHKFTNSKIDATSTAINSGRHHESVGHSGEQAVDSIKNASTLNIGRLKMPNIRPGAMPKSAGNRKHQKILPSSATVSIKNAD